MRVLVIRSYGAGLGALGIGQRLLDEVDALREEARRMGLRVTCLLHNAVAGNLLQLPQSTRRRP